MTKRYLSLLYVLLYCLVNAIGAAASDEMLSPGEAFEFKAEVKDQNTLLLIWDIADRHYLYQHKFKFASDNPGIEIGNPVFPAGQTKQDQFFGSVTIYRQHLEIELPFQQRLPKLDKFNLKVVYQGCADNRICYLPVKKTVSVDLNADGLLHKIGALLWGNE